MKQEDILAELPRDCRLGVKKSSKGHLSYWRGYKIHLDVADGDIPVSAIVTGAKVHDSQVAVALVNRTSKRVTYLYDLMDAAYDAHAIREHSLALNHKPIIDPVQRQVHEPKCPSARTPAALKQWLRLSRFTANWLPPSATVSPAQSKQPFYHCVCLSILLRQMLYTSTIQHTFPPHKHADRQTFPTFRGFCKSVTKILNFSKTLECVI